MGYCIQTWKGHKIQLDDFRNSILDIEDIAHALGNLCRWTGHVNDFYSVAEHSVRVSEICQNKMDGLLHDATEAYLNDISSPVKKSGNIQQYLDLEDKLYKEIAFKYNIAEVIPADVKHADLVMLHTEKRDLFNYFDGWVLGEQYKPLKKKIKPWSPKKAKTKFLDRYYELLAENK